MDQLSQRQLRISKLLDKEEYLNIAGVDWPNFEDFKISKNIPPFVFDELETIFPIPQTINYMEFYITNVCNLTCTNCRSFNNFDFKGHLDFNLELYQEWAKLLDLDHYVILGGEPLLHPNFKAWAEGLRKLWPNTWAKIDSNGTYISKIKNLHQLLVDNQYYLCINIHDHTKQHEILQDIKSTFGICKEIDHTDPRIYYSKWFNKIELVTSVGSWLITDLGLPIHLRPAWSFVNMPSGSTNWQDLVAGKSNEKSIYMGDANLAHDACTSSRCHVMSDGKIYKCSTMATMANFLKQKNISWPHDLLYQYQPITLDTYSNKSIDSLKHTIPQCSFCACETGTTNISDSSYAKKNKIFTIKHI